MYVARTRCSHHCHYKRTATPTDNRTGVGAAYGTAKSGIGISGVGTFRPDLIMKASTAPALPRTQAS